MKHRTATKDKQRLNPTRTQTVTFKVTTTAQSCLIVDLLTDPQLRHCKYNKPIK